MLFALFKISAELANVSAKISVLDYHWNDHAKLDNNIGNNKNRPIFDFSTKKSTDMTRSINRWVSWKNPLQIKRFCAQILNPNPIVQENPYFTMFLSVCPNPIIMFLSLALPSQFSVTDHQLEVAFPPIVLCNHSQAESPHIEHRGVFLQQRQSAIHGMFFL